MLIKQNLKTTIENIIYKENLRISFDEIEPYIQPSVSLLKNPKDSNLPLGISKMGGFPHLPPELDIPAYSNGKQLQFILQINCKDVCSYDLNNELPSSGMLYFFLDIEDLPHYAEFGDSVKNSWKVLYFDGDLDTLSIRETEEVSELIEHSISFKTTYSVLEPYENRDVYEEGFLESYGNDVAKLYAILPKEQHNNLDDISGTPSAASNDFKPYHRLLGYHENVQADAKLEIITNFLKIPESNTSATKLEKSKWSMLFQFDYDEDLNWYLDGKIHFFIRNQDLKNKDFSDTYVSWNC